MQAVTLDLDKVGERNAHESVLLRDQALDGPERALQPGEAQQRLLDLLCYHERLV